MSLILSLILTITVVIIYILMIQIFTVLFRITGLTQEKARFQVISLLTNSGFSTNESELIMTNRSRRKIAKVTMITGTIFNVLIVSLLINILFSIKLNDELYSLKLLGLAVLGFIALIIIIRLPFFKNSVERIIEKVATKINDKKHHENIITELDKYGMKSVVEVYISKLPNVIKGKNVEQAALRSRYNIIVLLIQRNGRLLNVKRDTIIQKGDRVVMFGKTAYIRELFDVTIEDEKVIREENNNIMSIIDNYGSNVVAEIEIKEVPPIVSGKTLGESILKEEYNINVIMLTRNEEVVLVDANTRIEIGDKVMLFGPYQHIKYLFIKDEDRNIR